MRKNGLEIGYVCTYVRTQCHIDVLYMQHGCIYLYVLLYDQGRLLRCVQDLNYICMYMYVCMYGGRCYYDDNKAFRLFVWPFFRLVCSAIPAQESASVRWILSWRRSVFVCMHACIYTCRAIWGIIRFLTLYVWVLLYGNLKFADTFGHVLQECILYAVHVHYSSLLSVSLCETLTVVCMFYQGGEANAVTMRSPAIYRDTDRMGRLLSIGIV